MNQVWKQWLVSKKKHDMIQDPTLAKYKLFQKMKKLETEFEKSC